MRPLADSFEIRFTSAASLGVRALGRFPAGIRRRVLTGAFSRAERAFNRGDLAAVFALFADDVEYVPPPPLRDGTPIVGRSAVLAFWEQTMARFDESRITNLSVEETAPSRFVRTAELAHRASTETLRYTIRQTTELRNGRVYRQVNELLAP